MSDSEYQPDPGERAVLADIERDIKALQAEHEAYLRRVAKIHNLQGNWMFDGKKFIKQVPAA